MKFGQLIEYNLRNKPFFLHDQKIKTKNLKNSWELRDLENEKSLWNSVSFSIFCQAILYTCCIIFIAMTQIWTFLFKIPNTNYTNWMKIIDIRKNRSSLPEALCQQGVIRNFAKLTGKHLCQSLFFNSVAGQSLVLTGILSRF